MEFPTEAINQLEEVCKRNQRLDGWRTGNNLNEARRKRIKRIRRWKKLPARYPESVKVGDKFAYKLVSYSPVRGNGYELFVTEHQTPDFSRISEWKKTQDYPMRKQYNGYCRFMRKPVIEEGYNGLLRYVPVHGGITYAHHEHGVSVYGFDTAHLNDENNPLCLNVEWIEANANMMAIAIKVAARYERDYLKFKSFPARAMIIHKFLGEVEKKTKQTLNITNNFGCMINMLSGQL